MPNINNNKFSFKSCYKYSRPQNIIIDKTLYDKVNNFTEKTCVYVANNCKSEERNQDESYKEIIKPIIRSNQSSYLKNINEYNVKENYNLDEDRFFKLNMKHKNNYNIVSHTKNNFAPLEIKIDKWPKYYEKYF